MVNFISIRDLRPGLATVMERIHKRFDRYIVTKRGKPEMVMMSMDDYESMIETLDIESDKVLMHQLKKAQHDMEKGKGTSLEKIHKDLGLV